MEETEKQTLVGTIIGFTKFDDGQDKDCTLLLKDGSTVLFDPFVGCAWEYGKRNDLLNKEIKVVDVWLHSDENGRPTDVWLCNEESIEILNQVKN